MKKTILIILDGWGLGKIKKSDAIRAAHTPIVDGLYEKYPHSTLITFGTEVGLPQGQMGNSEVGHLNIGAGRVVFQELARINNSIEENTLQNKGEIQKLITYCNQKNKPLHLMGLVSDGGVHSHINHLLALVDIFNRKSIPIHLHLFLDGRDTDPKSGIIYLQRVLDHIQNTSAQLVSVIGRYFAMDRDQRWERIKQAYDLIVNGEGIQTNDVIKEIKNQYDKGVTDEFMPPIILNKTKCIKDKDALLFFNFRTDRPRQITQVLTQEDMPDHNMHKLDLNYVTMTKYSDAFKGIDAVFNKDPLNNTLGEVISQKGLSQVRIAETEKYPHVTFFFSGGNEEKFPLEKRILIPSPKVATYDLQPEMSAPELTNSTIEEIMSNNPDFICLNYANADMVGHTGNFNAAIQAVETVDSCLGELIDVAIAADYEIIIIADHGNSDYMINEDGSPNTSHTTNLVPVIYVSKRKKATLINGNLADIAPTILAIMGLNLPGEMTGKNLIVGNS